MYFDVVYVSMVGALARAGGRLAVAADRFFVEAPVEAWCAQSAPPRGSSDRPTNIGCREYVHVWATAVPGAAAICNIRQRTLK